MLNKFLCKSALLEILNIKKTYTKIIKDEPANPHSSPTVEKIKSVCCWGTNLPLVWEPFKKPSPKNPPDASAILDWLVL